MDIQEVPNHPQTPIEGLTGIALKRSFLLSLQVASIRYQNIRAMHIDSMDNEAVERLVSDLIVEQNNLDLLANKIEEEAAQSTSTP